MRNFESLSTPELEGKLAQLRDLFDEVTEERAIILGQENLHLSSKLVTKYAAELADINNDIEQVEKLLAERKG
jgi:hypothetical protein